MGAEQNKQKSAKNKPKTVPQQYLVSYGFLRKENEGYSKDKFSIFLLYFQSRILGRSIILDKNFTIFSTILTTIPIKALSKSFRY
jgi:hypothetical protein